MPERVSPHAGMSDETLEHHLKRYEFATPYVRDKVVVSMACGNGYGEHTLATVGGATRVLAYDISEEAINFARANYQATNLEYRVGNALHIDLPDHSVDIVVSFETIEHITDDRGYLKEVRRLLKPGGIAIISTPNRAKSLKNYFSRMPLNRFHVREYLYDDLMVLLKENFSSVEPYGQKVLFKRRLSTLPLYLWHALTGSLRDIEVYDYVVKPYPTAPMRETAIFVMVCR